MIWPALRTVSVQCAEQFVAAGSVSDMDKI
jgi:hypothetical protein